MVRKLLENQNYNYNIVGPIHDQLRDRQLTEVLRRTAKSFSLEQQYGSVIR
jgi:hypothetical protein